LDGLTIARDAQPDLLILDWILPGISGLGICLRLRSTDVQVPIIMLTAKDEVPDRVTGLNAGVDNYVTKPFSMEEVLARGKAHLHRSQPNEPNKL
jgi:DNA-binding response OmpR family regulator